MVVVGLRGRAGAEVRRATAILLCVLALASTSVFALDSNELRAVELGLRALRMTPVDLAFKKDMTESEFILHPARVFLQSPLMLPESGEAILHVIKSVNSLDSATSFPRVMLNVSLKSAPTRHVAISSNLPPAVAQAVDEIYSAALSVKPVNKKLRPALDAFAVESLRLDKDAAELDAWDKLGMDTRALRELLKRDEQLELQDAELGTAVLEAADGFDLPEQMSAFWRVANAANRAVSSLRTTKFTGEFQIEQDTELGKIIIGGVGRNVYTNEAFLIIDLGGDDIYLNSAGGANGLVGRPVSVVIDLAGNDHYISRQSFSQGAGLFGIGILADCGGDDVYVAKHLSQGAGFSGCGLLADYGGHDSFEADTFCQGAGMFGAGVLWQRGGNTTYRANQMTQGFGGVQGCGLLLDEAGNDVYVAGGKEACPWTPGHYFTLAQGMGFGMRPFAGGGVGVLCDLKGDDRYVADVYGQGVSYWYAVGMLLDAEGNDSYEAYQYVQGAGIHLSSGLLMDWTGNDQYTARALCQGTAHDYSVGILVDRAGNDRYMGDSTAQGGAINNSFALLLDCAGDDFYAGHDPNLSQGSGHDGGKREYGSIALLLDLAGRDTYSQGQTNGMMWLKPLYGAGLDCEWKNQSPAVRKDVERPPETVPPPRRRVYEPVDVHHPVERLLRRATRDTEKEENKKDAEAAWGELKRQGTNALPYLVMRLDTPNVWLRAKVEELVDYLGTNAVPVLVAGMNKARNDEVARVCCYFLARFETATNAIPHVMPLLERKDTRATALYTLGHLRAREVFLPAIAGLTDKDEIVRLRCAQALGRLGDRRAIPKLVAALDDELWDVRYAAEDALVVMGQPARAALRGAFAKTTPRAQAHIIEALAKLGDARSLSLAHTYYRRDDSLVRATVEKQLQELLRKSGRDAGI